MHSLSLSLSLFLFLSLTHTHHHTPTTNTHTHTPQALKGIALMRMGRQDEGSQLIEEVMKARPGDQATLQAVTMYFREIGNSESMQLG